MVSLVEAEDLVKEQARSFGVEKVLLDEAYGRVVAEKITADRDYPPFNRAAMDGFAFMFSDWNSGLRSFAVREIIYAGSVASVRIEHGECYKIMTGAAVPEPADTIIRREDVTEEDNYINCLPVSLDLYQHIARRGEDLKMNELVCSQAVLCSSPVIGLFASIGKHELTVARLPRVSIITTGNEIVNIHEAVNEVQIRDSNSHVLRALLKKWNISPVSIIHVKDELHEIQSALESASTEDIIIICGGVSAGDADYTPEVLHKLGATKIFHKVAIRPGKPIWFGKFERGAVVFALPGNPFSCMVTFKLFIDLFLSCSFGLGIPAQFEYPINSPRLKKTSLDEFFPVKILGTPSCIQMIHFNGSGDIKSAVGAQAIAHHPQDRLEIPAGTILKCYHIS